LTNRKNMKRPSSAFAPNTSASRTGFTPFISTSSTDGLTTLSSTGCQQWRAEQDRYTREIGWHQAADQSYLEEGVRLLEVASQAHDAFEDSGHGHIPDRVDIDRRPAIVERKARLGDWELDTIIGAKHRGALVSMAAAERRRR
jgi:hypothetical protein